MARASSTKSSSASTSTKAKAAKPAAKASAKPATKTAAKPAAKGAKATKPAAKAAKPAARQTLAAAPAPVKATKVKLVRDSFTMPEQEYALLAKVKKDCLKAGVEVKKSELLRVGVALVSQIDLATLQQVLASLPQLKTGRPRSE